MMLSASKARVGVGALGITKAGLQSLVASPVNRKPKQVMEPITLPSLSRRRPKSTNFLHEQSLEAHLLSEAPDSLLT